MKNTKYPKNKAACQWRKKLRCRVGLSLSPKIYGELKDLAEEKYLPVATLIKIIIFKHLSARASKKQKARHDGKK